MLAAAVAACSQSVVQVLQLAPEAIDLAVRVGAEAERRAALIEDRSEEGSWIVVASGLSEDAGEKILRDFNQQNVPNLPAHHQERKKKRKKN